MATTSDQAQGTALAAAARYVTPAPARTRERLMTLGGRGSIYLILIVGAVVISLPWSWMVMSSLKGNVEIHSFPIHFLPQKVEWNNYWEVIYYGGKMGLWPRWFLNTVIIAAFVTVGTLLSNSLVAFSLSRLRWRWRNQFFFLVLASMMLPAQVTMIPQYLVFTKGLHWTDTWYPQIVPAFFGSAWAIFLLRQFMMTIPVELDEAARLDGCSDFDLFWRVVLPMSKPALGAIAIFTFGAVWNDLFTPLLYIRDPQLMNVAFGLSGMRTMGALFGQRFPRDELAMAASLMTSLPMVILFFVFQKYYIQGVVITGVKG